MTDYYQPYLRVLAYSMLLIWDPTKMENLPEPDRSKQMLYYRTRGIVSYDRAINGEPILR